MDFVIDAVKSDLGLVLETGWYLLGGLFSLAVFLHYLGVLSTKVNWASLLIRFIIGFVILQNYVWIMDLTKDIVVGLNDRINPEQSAILQYAQMSENMQQAYEAEIQPSLINNVKNFLFGKFTLHNIIINISFIFFGIVTNVMETIRYSLLAILYKMGPILVPLILFQATRRVLQGWYVSFVSILAWPILWHITLSIAVALSAQIVQTGEGIEQFAALNFAVCFVLIFSPMIISGLVAGIGLGGAAVLAGAVASRSTFNSINKVGQTIQKGARKIDNLNQGKTATANNNGRYNFRNFTSDVKGQSNE